MASTKPYPAPAVPTASDIMTRALVVLTPAMPILDAARLLLKHEISGAPVLDEDGCLVGICSEFDCLRVLSTGAFYADDHGSEGVVAHYMTTVFHAAEPHQDIYALAQFFLTHGVRRLPVLEGGRLVGQVSRRDVLRAVAEFDESRLPRRHFPDYREPSEDVGARRAR
ncbi:MAG: CBS domain-containing protein [Myxococcota bacterium]